MSDTATQEGVVDNEDVSAVEPQDEAKPREKTQREIAMEQLAAVRRTDLEQEAGVKFEQEDADPDETDAEAARAKLEAEADKQVAATDDAVIEEAELPLTQKVKVKIDGEERIVTIDELRREYQKAGAADKRLEEASRILRETKEIRDAVGANKPPDKKDETTPAPEPGAGKAKVKDAIKQALSALYEGDEDVAAERLAAVLEESKPKQPEGRDATLDPAQIAERVKEQLEEDRALEEFAGAFKQIATDPYLAEIADRHLEAELASGKHRSKRDAYMAAGKKTQDWMVSKGLKVESEAKPSAANLDERRSRKAELTQIASAGTRSTSSEEPQKTATDTIAEMRKQRGQA